MTEASLLPEASVLPSGANARHVMVCLCPLKVAVICAWALSPCKNNAPYKRTGMLVIVFIGIVPWGSGGLADRRVGRRELALAGPPCGTCISRGSGGPPAA